MEGDYMKFGASDRFFYYTLTGKATFDMRIQMSFRDPFDLAAMKASADEALEYIPEFNKRIVLRGGRPEAVVGSGNTAFIPEEEKKPVLLGSEETNGLLFCFKYKEKTLTLSSFHGLSDAYGLKFYLRTMLYLYLKKTGAALSAEEESEITAQIRTQKGLPSDADPDDLFMPYEKWGDPEAKPAWTFENPGAFAIPETPYGFDSDYIHMCSIELPYSEMQKERERLGTSMLPLLTDILSMGTLRTFPCGEKTIVAMSAVDQRRIFHSKNLVNCSDSVFFPYTAGFAKKDEEERCRELKAIMKRQLATENHLKMAGDKVLTVREFEKDPEGAVALAEKLANMPSTDNFTPMTFVVTWIGDLSMGTAIDSLFDDMMLYGVARAFSSSISVFGDKMHFMTANQNDSCAFAEGIAREMNRRGLHAKITSETHLYGDQFVYDRIEEREEKQ